MVKELVYGIIHTQLRCLPGTLVHISSNMNCPTRVLGSVYQAEMVTTRATPASFIAFRIADMLSVNLVMVPSSCLWNPRTETTTSWPLKMGASETGSNTSACKSKAKIISGKWKFNFTLNFWNLFVHFLHDSSWTHIYQYADWGRIGLEDLKDPLLRRFLIGLREWHGDFRNGHFGSGTELFLIFIQSFTSSK